MTSGGNNCVAGIIPPTTCGKAGAFLETIMSRACPTTSETGKLVLPTNTCQLWKCLAPARRLFVARFSERNRQNCHLKIGRFAICFFAQRGRWFIVNPVRQSLADTKDDAASKQAPHVKMDPGMMVETPEAVMEKFHRQATYLGPVMEEILRTAHGRGQSHWGLNE